jgi:hypothetical protein
VRRLGGLAQKALTMQTEDHRVTTASWALCLPLPPQPHLAQWWGRQGGLWSPEPRQPLSPATHTHCKRGLRPFGSVFLQGWNTREDCDQSLFKGQIGGEGPPLL